MRALCKTKKIKNKNKFIFFLDGTSARDFSRLHEQGTYHIWCSATLVLHLKRIVVDVNMIEISERARASTEFREHNWVHAKYINVRVRGLSGPG